MSEESDLLLTSEGEDWRLLLNFKIVTPIESLKELSESVVDKQPSVSYPVEYANRYDNLDNLHLLHYPEEIISTMELLISALEYAANVGTSRRIIQQKSSAATVVATISEKHEIRHSNRSENLIDDAIFSANDESSSITESYVLHDEEEAILTFPTSVDYSKFSEAIENTDELLLKESYEQTKHWLADELITQKQRSRKRALAMLEAKTEHSSVSHYNKKY